MCITVFETTPTTKKAVTPNNLFFLASCEVLVWNNSVSFWLHSLGRGKQTQGHYGAMRCGF